MKKLTANMVKTLKNLAIAGTVDAEQGTAHLNSVGCTFPALCALQARGLAAMVKVGENEDGDATYVWAITAAGRDANQA